MPHSDGTQPVMITSPKTRTRQARPLRFAESTLDEWTSVEFWTSVCPNLTLLASEEDPDKPSTSSSSSSSRDDPSPRANSPSHGTLEESCHRLGSRRKASLRSNGYAAVREPFLDNDGERSLIGRLRDGIEQLECSKIPPTFIFLFDEAWELAKLSSSRVLSPSTHEKNRFNFDLLAWHIGPPVDGSSQGDRDASRAAPPASGFSPHRDRQPDDVASSFHEDGGDAKFVTHWLALSDAVPENSCLFMIPRHVDPGYDLGDNDDDEASDDDPKAATDNGCGPLYRALCTKESFQHVRAFPCQPGQGVLFTHRIAHWGSARDLDTDLPARIAMSFVCSDPSFEPSYLVNSDQWVNSATGILERPPPFAVRLLLVCGQLLIYHQRLQLSRQTLQNCYEYCKRHQDQLETTNRHKVMVEFVSAMKECAQQPKQPLYDGLHPNGSKDDGSDDDEEEDEEAMMEAMLNAEAEGYGEFQDDYDDLEDENGGSHAMTDGELHPSKKARKGS